MEKQIFLVNYKTGEAIDCPVAAFDNEKKALEYIERKSESENNIRSFAIEYLGALPFEYYVKTTLPFNPKD